MLCPTQAEAAIPPTHPHPTRPRMLAQTDPLVGRGALGSHRLVVRPGEPSRLRERLRPSRGREWLARSSPPGAWPPHRAFGLCVPARPPGTQPPLPSGGWRASFWRNPFEASRPQPHSRRPLPRPSQRGHEAVRVSCVGVGLRRFKGVFKGQYGLKIHLLKGTDSGPWTPARKAHKL